MDRSLTVTLPSRPNPQANLHASLVASLKANVVAAVLLLVASSFAVAHWLAVERIYVAKAVTVFALIVFAVWRTISTHPYPSLGPANQVTLGRGIIVALLAGFIGETGSPLIAVLTVAAGLLALVLDGVDGRLARATRMASPFGARFDMEIDALLILLLALLAWQFDKAGSWILASGLLRYAFIAAGYLLPWFDVPLPHNGRRQAVCVAQVGALLVVMMPFVVPPLSSLIAAASLAALLGSFGADVLWLSRNRSNHAAALP